jgi:halocin C8-like bacteriocin domain-containing protein
MTRPGSPVVRFFEIEGDGVKMVEFDPTLFVDEPDETACTVDESTGLACATGALDLSKCGICKKVVAVVLKYGPGKACGPGAVFVCGAIGVGTAGVGGLICAGATYAVCKLGISQLAKYGATYACTKISYCQ